MFGAKKLPLDFPNKGNNQLFSSSLFFWGFFTATWPCRKTMPCCWHPCPSCWSIAWTEVRFASTTHARRPESWSKHAACWQVKRYASVRMTQVKTEKKRKKTGEANLRGLFEGGGGRHFGRIFFFEFKNESRFILWWLTFFWGSWVTFSQIEYEIPSRKTWLKTAFNGSRLKLDLWVVWCWGKSDCIYQLVNQTFCPIQL